MNEDGHSDQGVFGNLPRTRPGTRSPLREGAADAPAPAAKPRDPDPPHQVDAPERPDPLDHDWADEAEGDERPAPGPPQGDGAPASLEDLAWAGIAVLAEAATVGVKLATRAMEAARDAADRH